MAVAPLNKFLTIAVPVAPGEQTLFEANVGTSAIVLYAQVSNVGTGVTFPTVTFSHRRRSVATSTAGNLRNNRIVNIYENLIPCNKKKCAKINSIFKVDKIVELKAGTVKKLNIKVEEIVEIENF